MLLEENTQSHPRVLILSANALVRTNVRVLLGSMRYQCFVASTLEEALALGQQIKPDAAVLDPHQTGSAPAWIVATFLRRFPHLRGSTIALTDERSDPELLRVLGAYSVARVRLDNVLQELWPSLDSLLRGAGLPEHVTHSACLVFDSFFQPALTGLRSGPPTTRQLHYESGTLVADLSLEGQRDSQHLTLTGQVLDESKPRPELGGISVVFQGQAGLISIVKTNELGEFCFEFDFEPRLTLELQAKTNYWVSITLPDLGNRSNRPIK